jgi:hypothetical protein
MRRCCAGVKTKQEFVGFILAERPLHAYMRPSCHGSEGRFI